MKVAINRKRISDSCFRKTLLASLFFTPDVDTDIIRLMPTEKIIPTIVNKVEITDSSTTILLRNVGNKTDIIKDAKKTMIFFMIAVIFPNTRSLPYRHLQRSLWIVHHYH